MAVKPQHLASKRDRISAALIAVAGSVTLNDEPSHIHIRAAHRAGATIEQIVITSAGSITDKRVKEIVNA